MVKAVNLACYALWRSVRSDPQTLETYARLVLSHTDPDRYGAPVVRLASLLGENVVTRFWFSEARRDVCEIYIQIKGIEPPIWRTLVIPSTATLREFHFAIQGALGWEESHLHVFEAGEHRFEDHFVNPEPYGKDENDIGVFDFFALAGGDAIYRYDFGDNWEHTIRLVERRLDDSGPVPRCIDGARNAPPEDIGGVYGYTQMIAALKHPESDEFADFREWRPQGYDPEAFSAEAATKAMEGSWPGYWRETLADILSGAPSEP